MAEQNEPKRLRLDGVETYLSAQLEDDATTVLFTGRLTQDGGQTIQPFAENEYLALSILDANYRLREIVHLWNYDGEAAYGTIERGMEGTWKATHPEGSKVVHAATVDDFLMVQDHESDPTAHEEHIERIAQGLIDTSLEAHELEENDRHPYYAKKEDASFSGDIVFEEGSTVHVYGDMYIEEGASLIVDGEIVINGKITINGIELWIGDEPPDPISANMVWIQTYGATPPA